MKKLFFAIPLFFALATSTGCAQSPPEANTAQNEQPSIISLSPSITGTLIDLGLTDYLVGVDIHSAGHHPALESLPLFDLFNLDLEQLLAIDPDFIFLAFFGPETEGSPFAPVIDLHERIHMIPPSDSLSHIAQQITDIGAILGVDSSGMVNDMNQRIDHILSAVAQLNTPAPRVYFEVSADPTIFTIGEGTFISHLLEVLGAENIFGDQMGWIPVSEEVVLNRNPQVIFTNVSYLDDPVATILNRNGWHTTDAVADGQVFLIDPVASSHSNHTIVIPLEEMARALFLEINLD